MSGNYLLRPLDPAEKFIWLMDHISCANFVVMADLAGQPIADDILRRGLDKLQALHPLLSARVQEADDGTVAFYREEGTRIPLRVEERREEDWQAAIEAEFNTRFDDVGLPLVRCLLLELPGRSVLGLIFHHAIADGRAGLSVLADLLRFCLRGVEPSAPEGIPPPMHSLFPPEFRWQDNPGMARELSQQMTAEFQHYGEPAALPFLAHQNPERQPRLKQLRLDASQGRGLQERCRAEGISVHGAVCAALLIATHGLFDDDDPKTLYLMCPVDQRPHLSSDRGEQVSYCTTFLRSNYRITGPDAFWSVAREIGDDFKRRLRRGDGYLMYAALPLETIASAGPSFEAFVANVERLPAGSNISNVGRIPPLEDCPEVQAISGALCSLPKHLTSLNVGSYKDLLVINMTYDASKLPARLADRLADSVLDLLCRAAAFSEASAAI